jgi:hypothetical protein
MSRSLLTRRRFLTLPLALALAPVARAWAQPRHRRGLYAADVGLLYSALTLNLEGTIDEMVDGVAGRYQVTAVGQGARISNRIESEGVRRDGRWAPVRTVAWFQVVGREGRSELTYDYECQTVHYQYRGETFFLRRLRTADDVVTIPPGAHLDDALSATLSYAEDRWPPSPDGTYRTHIVRRRRPENEGPDDVQRVYRAEIVPFELRVGRDPETGKPAAHFDLTRFSSWARQSHPARVLFDANRRPETILASLMLGTSVTLRIKSAG